MTAPLDQRAVLEQIGVEETTTDKTSTDVYKAMIRIDRLAVAKYFDAPIEDLMETHEIDGITALAFVHMRNEGMKDREAYNTAANLTNEALWSYFAPDDDEDEPETPAGKGGPSETDTATTEPGTDGPSEMSSPTSSPTAELTSVSPTA